MSEDVNIGCTWRGWNGDAYLCESYDSRAGYWLVNVNDETDRRCVSERALGRTFRIISAASPAQEDRGD